MVSQANIYILPFGLSVHKCHISNITELLENSNNTKKKEENSMSFLPAIITYVNRYQAVGVEDFFLEN